ncbi:MAG: hypothetical protein HC852_23425 [Acaryochloridaceae cyanobacterium RU_4_10]|nr:hypothetical protein [Acaryochloridaceae cyanobacterium RU_4_10]
MKKLTPLLLGILFVSSTTACGKAPEAKVSENSGVIPAGTKIEVSVPAEISTGKNRNNDRLIFPVDYPLVGGNPVLKGAKVEGHLENVVKAEKGRKASLHLVFDNIVFKNGSVKPIDAQLLNTKVETKTKGKFLKNAGIIMGGAVAGHFLGKKTGVKHGGLGGAAAATAFVLTSPGGEVVLKKGTDLDLKLKSPIEPEKTGI